MPDPNWLLSSAAQSAAAIVAIVGGFLVSRIVSVSAERNALKARLAEETHNLELRRAAAEGAEERLRDRRASRFIAFALPLMVEARGEVELSGLLDGMRQMRSRSPELTEAQLQPYFESSRELVRRAFTLFEGADPGARFPRDMADYVTSANIELPDEREQWTYERVYDKVREARLEEQRERQPRYMNPLADFGGLSLPSPIALQASEAEAEARRRQFEQMVRDRDQAVSQFHWQESQVETLARQLDRYVVPEHFFGGVVVLVYFAAAGIVLPMALMPADAATFSEGHKWIVVAFFVSGLLSVLTFLGVLARTVGK